MPVLRTASEKINRSYNHINLYDSDSDGDYEPGSIAQELALVDPKGASFFNEIGIIAKINTNVDPLFQEIEDSRKEIESLGALLIQKTARGFLGRRKVIKLKQRLQETKQCRSDSSDSLDSTSTVSDFEYQQELDNFKNPETKQCPSDSSKPVTYSEDGWLQFQFEEEYLNDDGQVDQLQQYQSREQKVA
ncbi:MAG: hypothetical protein ACON35_00350 [Candidatus Marinamargulisbacteria bacterium]